MPNPENTRIAVGISLIACLQADLCTSGFRLVRWTKLASDERKVRCSYRRRWRRMMLYVQLNGIRTYNDALVSACCQSRSLHFIARKLNSTNEYELQSAHNYRLQRIDRQTGFNNVWISPSWFSDSLAIYQTAAQHSKVHTHQEWPTSTGTVIFKGHWPRTIGSRRLVTSRWRRYWFSDGIA